MTTYSANQPDPYAQINPRTGQPFGEIPCATPTPAAPAKATCDFCGEEVLCSDLDEFNACPDCHQEPVEDDLVICSNCNGSGEGMHEGTRCYVCHGKGTV